jgi:hypothetical protein
MKSKTVLILIVAVVLLAAVAAVLLRPWENDTERSDFGQAVFSDLPFQKVEKIRLVSSTETVTLAKGPGGWTVVEKGNYPADFDKISELVEKLREAKVGRQFSADPEVLDRLGLHLPSEAGVNPEKSAKQLVLLDGEDRPLADILVGKPRESDRGFGGQYLMRSGQSTVLLVDQTFRFLSAAPEKWLHLQVIDLDADTVETVAFYPRGDDAPDYELRRPQQGEDFVLADPSGQPPVKQGKAGRVAEALSPLEAEDVNPAEDTGAKISFSDADRFVYTTFEGSRYEIELGSPFTRKEESYTPARLSKKLPPDAASEEKSDEYSGWVYLLSKWKTEDFIKDRKELLASEKNSP